MTVVVIASLEVIFCESKEKLPLCLLTIFCSSSVPIAKLFVFKYVHIIVKNRLDVACKLDWTQRREMEVAHRNVIFRKPILCHAYV